MDTSGADFDVGIAALPLFVAASMTIIGEADYVAADLSACKSRYAHTETCIQLDLNGYFTSSNASGLSGA